MLASVKEKGMGQYMTDVMLASVKEKGMVIITEISILINIYYFYISIKLVLFLSIILNIIEAIL